MAPARGQSAKKSGPVPMDLDIKIMGQASTSSSRKSVIAPPRRQIYSISIFIGARLVVGFCVSGLNLLTLRHCEAYNDEAIQKFRCR